MKKTVRLSLFVVMMTVVSLLLTACSAGKSQSAYDNYAYTEDMSYAGAVSDAYYEDDYDWGLMEEYGEIEAMEAPQMETSIPTTQDNESKLIYRAYLNLETVKYEETVEQIRSLMEKSGGYIENNENYNYGGYRSCSFVIRVPRENYRSFVTNVNGLEMVLSFSENVENVSQTYYDTQLRLESAKKELSAYQDLYEQAETVEEMLTITSAINEVQFRIDNYSGTLRSYDALVSYSTVTIDVTEVSRLRGQEAPAETFGQKLSKAFARGWDNAVDGMQDMVLDFAAAWFGWLVFILIVLAAWLVIRRIVRKSKEKKLRQQQMYQMAMSSQNAPMAPVTQEAMMPQNVNASEPVNKE